MATRKAKRDVFPFGPEMQNQMLALMLKDVSFRSHLLAHVGEERLYSEAHRWFFKKIKEYSEKAVDNITYILIEDDSKFIEKSKRALYLNFTKTIFGTRIEDEKLIKDKMTQYAREIAFVDIFTAAQVEWNKGNKDKAYEITQKGSAELYGINFTNEASIPIQDFLKRRREFLAGEAHRMRKIPTGITPLDDILHGGIELGELGIILAEPKKGKSIALNHMSCAAIGYGARVAEFVLEGTTEQSMFRKMSRLSNIDYHKIANDELTTEESRMLDKIITMLADKLHLVPFNQHWNYTPLDLEAKLEEMIAGGFDPELLVIDYADLFKASHALKEKRHEQTEVYRDLKRLAVMRKKAIWTASQARRPEDKPELEYLLRSKDISESFEKVRIADFVATLNQTPKEKDFGIMRFHLDIYRSNDMDRTIKLLTNYEKMIFFSKKYGYATSTDFHAWMNKKKR